MTVSETIDVRGGILAAHDGSANATSALEIAVRLARALKTHITVVRAWNLSTAPTPENRTFGYVPAWTEFAAATLADLESDVTIVRGINPDVEIVTRVVHGNAAEKLVKASSSVDLIVIGGRGRGGFTGLTLGSVCEQVLRHAECPVLVDKLPRQAAENMGVSKREDLARALASELKVD